MVDKQDHILEVGPGPGILSFSLNQMFDHFKAVELDRDMIANLRAHISPEKIIHEDFLKLDLINLFEGPFFLVGNFPYNISSQIIFKMIEHHDIIPGMIGMFQREVADRICSTPGGKQNGILSLNAQAYYKTEKLFDIPPEAFNPPPKVWSSVIRLTRLEESKLQCDTKLYTKVIKQAFSQRRKKLRNTLKSFLDTDQDEIFQKRPEQLSVDEFVNIVNKISNQ